MTQIRLADRGQRLGLNNYRKQVFLETASSGQKVVVVQIVDPNFKPILDKNIQVLKLCDQHAIQTPKILSYDGQNLKLTMTWVGENLLEIKNCDRFQLLKLGFQELKKLNSINLHRARFREPIYIQNLRKAGGGQKSEITRLIQLMDSVQNLPMTMQVGYGTTDPISSNFCFDGKKSLSH